MRMVKIKKLAMHLSCLLPDDIYTSNAHQSLSPPQSVWRSVIQQTDVSERVPFQVVEVSLGTILITKTESEIPYKWPGLKSLLGEVAKQQNEFSPSEPVDKQDNEVDDGKGQNSAEELADAA